MRDPGLVYGPTSRIVARCILDAQAYLLQLQKPQDTWLRWRAGYVVPAYTDCRLLAGHPAESAIIASAMASSIRANFPDAELIVGMAEAGIGWAALVGVELALPHAFVRKQEKQHGQKGRVACSPRQGSRAVVVDDLVASGNSLEQAILILRDEAQIETAGVQSIVNWDFQDMHDRFAALSVTPRALVSYPQILAEAQARRLLSRRAAAELMAFYRNPGDREWDLEALRSDPDEQFNVDQVS